MRTSDAYDIVVDIDAVLRDRDDADAHARDLDRVTGCIPIRLAIGRWRRRFTSPFRTGQTDPADRKRQIGA